MFILSRDRKSLISPVRLIVSKNFGSKNDKYLLMAYDNSSGIEAPVTLGGYPDEEHAVRELTAITEAIRRGDSVYTLSPITHYSE